ncbi:MAG TPA: hypothetical protein VMF65_25350 [Acidimicrobiales bacterium]|nr:hypothetical protein [Acidimicrobiales bacterium]
MVEDYLEDALLAALREACPIWDDVHSTDSAEACELFARIIASEPPFVPVVRGEGGQRVGTSVPGRRSRRLRRSARERGGLVPRSSRAKKCLGALSSWPWSWSRRRRRWVARSLLAAGAAFAVAVALLLPVLAAAKRPSGSFTTAWAPYVPVSGSSARPPTREPLGAFRLASYLAGASWRATPGPQAQFAATLTCPTVSSCYIVGQPIAVVNSPDQRALFSATGGTSWSLLRLPPGIYIGALSCPSARVCAAPGSIGLPTLSHSDDTLVVKKPVFVSTADGGHRWTVVPLPTGHQLELLSCSSASVCNAVWGTCPTQGARCTAEAATQQAFVRTTDGGASWYRESTFPSDARVQALSCPAEAECIVTGDYEKTASSLPKDFATVTTDGGRRWDRGRLDGSPSFGSLTAVSCSTASTCTAISVFSAVTSTSPRPPVQGAPLSICPSEMAPWHRGTGCPSLDPNVATTSNGGLTWSVRPFYEAKWTSFMGNTVALICSVDDRCGPSEEMWWTSVPPGPERGIFPVSTVGLSCPSPGRCWLATPWQLLMTTDAGQEWSAPDLPDAAARAAPTIPGVQAISCPEAGQCVAIGYPSISDIAAPVYSSVEVEAK